MHATPRRLPRLRLFALSLAAALLPSLAPAADLPKYLPNATEGVLSVNVKQLLGAALLKDNLDNLKLLSRAFGGGFMKVLDDLGVDPFADVDRITLAVPGGQQPESSTAFIQGKFNADKLKGNLEKLAKEHKDVLKEVKDDGYACWELTPTGTDRKFYLTALDDQTLVVSPVRGSVVEILAKTAGKKKHELNRDLAALLEKAKFDQSVSFAGLPGQLANGGQGGDLFGRLQNVVGGLNLSDEIKLEIHLAARNQDDAKVVQQQMKDGLNMARGILQVQAGQKPEIKSALQALDEFKVEQNGNTVTLRAQITKEMLDKLKP